MTPVYESGRGLFRLYKREIKIYSSTKIAEWFRSNSGTFFEMGHLPFRVADRLDGGDSRVFLSVPSLRKMLDRHRDLALMDFKKLTPWSEHTYFWDRRSRQPSVIGILDAQRLYKFSIKRTIKGELLLTSFHRTFDAQVRSIEKRFPKID